MSVVFFMLLLCKLQEEMAVKPFSLISQALRLVSLLALRLNKCLRDSCREVEAQQNMTLK